MRVFRKWYKSRTQWMNGAVVLIGLVEANTGEFRNQLGDDFGWFVVAIGMLGWYLRTITTQPLEEK